MAKLNEMDERQNKMIWKSKKAVLLYAASMFEINECTLEWFPEIHGEEEYVDLLLDVVISKLPDILRENYMMDAQYKYNFKSVHKIKAAQVKKVCRQDLNSRKV